MENQNTTINKEQISDSVTDQQFLYIVQWGSEKSICRLYQWNNEKTGTLYIVDNQTIANLSEIGVVIN